MANQFADGRFRFAVGIEDTFVPQTAVGRRALDEYELTQHYEMWSTDLELARASGATAMRYGIPWYLVNPQRGRFAWSWLDRVVDKLDELELETIVDLMHYGTPLWLDNQFLNASYADVVAEYAAAVADRYRGRLTAFTPLNEPLINAIFCGEEARWPPYLSGADGFVKLVRALVRGIVATQAAIDAVTGGESTFVHVEATQRFTLPSEPASEELVLLRNRVFLIEDLLTGRVDDDHELSGFLRANGFGDDDLAWCRDNTANPDVMGVNYYPHLTTVEVTNGARSAWPRIDGGTEGLAEVMRAFAARYGAPVFLTETSQTGSVADRVAWLDASVETLFRLRDDGIDVVGYTWWPLFDLVDWDYREGIKPADKYLVQMGIYDLHRDEIGRLERRHTPVVDRFRFHAEAAVAVS
ncbi:MAG: family 1 glycosylhydrolase [Gaiellaceae bacterium MAG52_C11]|nr:family 1 glycosylhydrolase [Candidatus Gaiellasilicea maunaloa]